MASQEHARIQWVDGVWELRDLGSRNGTRVNERVVRAGQAIVLAADDTIEFGCPDESWSFLDASAPVAAGRETRSGAIVVARDGMLRFPGAEPFPYVHQAGQQWLLELEMEQRLVRDGEVLSAGGHCWQLHLPHAVDGTEDVELFELCASAWTWHFFVSGDGEYVRLDLSCGERKIELDARAHHYLLLTLARLRERSDGWVYVDELCRMLALDERHLNVQIYRARSELGRAGVQDAAAIIERRRSTRQLRAGFDKFSVTEI